jgi:CRP-like cAMP-binding protein
VQEDQIGEILETVPFRIRRFRSGSMIAQSGEQVSSLMIVLSGTVKGEMVDDAGRVIKIEDIPAPGSLATAFIFGSLNRFPVNVVALSDGEILSIDKSDFLRLLMRNDMLLLNFLNMISNRSQFLSEKIKFLSFKTIRGKLAHYILQKGGSASTDVVMDMTQTELADFFGVARPSVSRALGEMEQQGIISASGRHIRITDRKKLTDLTLD